MHPPNFDEVPHHPSVTLVDRPFVSNVGLEIRIVTTVDVILDPIRPVFLFGNSHRRQTPYRPASCNNVTDTNHLVLSQLTL